MPSQRGNARRSVALLFCFFIMMAFSVGQDAPFYQCNNCRHTNQYTLQLTELSFTVTLLFLLYVNMLILFMWWWPCLLENTSFYQSNQLSWYGNKPFPDNSVIFATAYKGYPSMSHYFFVLCQPAYVFPMVMALSVWNRIILPMLLTLFVC